MIDWVAFNKMMYEAVRAAPLAENYILRDMLADPYEQHRWADDGGRNVPAPKPYPILRIKLPKKGY